MQPFFNEVLAAGNSRLAGTFVPKCTHLTSGERIEMYVKCGMIDKAGEEAVKAKDYTTLESLREKASGSQLVEIERLIGQVRRR